MQIGKNDSKSIYERSGKAASLSIHAMEHENTGIDICPVNTKGQGLEVLPRWQFREA